MHTSTGWCLRVATCRVDTEREREREREHPQVGRDSFYECAIQWRRWCSMRYLVPVQFAKATEKIEENKQNHPVCTTEAATSTSTGESPCPEPGDTTAGNMSFSIDLSIIKSLKQSGQLSPVTAFYGVRLNTIRSNRAFPFSTRLLFFYTGLSWVFPRFSFFPSLGVLPVFDGFKWKFVVFEPVFPNAISEDDVSWLPNSLFWQLQGNGESLDPVLGK